MTRETTMRRETIWHNALGMNVRKLAEIDCESAIYRGRGWVRCEALDDMYCLKGMCKFQKRRNEG